MLSCFHFFGSLLKFFLKSFDGPLQPFSHKSEITIAKQFFLPLTFCFLLLVLYCLKTYVNRLANCATEKFITLRSKYYKLFFYQNSFFLYLILCFLLQAPWCLKICVNCVTNSKMPNIYPNSLGHDKINCDLNIQYI